MLLVSLWVVGIKLSLPFNGGASSLFSHQALCGPGFVWSQWCKHSGSLVQEERQRDYEKVTAEEVVEMKDTDLDAYFAHVSSLIDHKRMSIYNLGVRRIRGK